uniref:Uncharacterized protein n=1 Tax=Panthera tigris altaica TaxID=74533 RepID=A0A8C9JQ38_PANTA
MSNLHKLLPNHMMETLYFYKREEDKQNCRNSEFSGLERILARHQFPKEINLTPNPSSMPLWRRKCINNANRGWKKCQLWNKSLEEPPMSTIVVRKHIQEDILQSHSLRITSRKLKEKANHS